MIKIDSIKFKKMYKECMTELVSEEHASEAFSPIDIPDIIMHDIPGGFMMYTDRFGEGVYLELIYVEKDSRGEGVADDLIQYLIDEYPKRNIACDIYNGNTASVRKFKSKGFKPGSTLYTLNR